MKKKLRNILQAGVILAIVFTFVIPGVATITKPIGSEEILDCSIRPDAEMGWVPVDASGWHAIDGHEITLYETGQLVTLEIYVSGWDPSKLVSVQSAVDPTGYSNSVGINLTPFGWPATPEDGCFINKSRSDYIFNGLMSIEAYDTASLNYRWGATLLGGYKEDDDQTYYFCTLILEVPNGANGTYTIDFHPDLNQTFLMDDGFQIIPLHLTAATITIQEPEPYLGIESISGGLGITATINNTGIADASQIECTLEATGGILGLINKTITEKLDIPIGNSSQLSTGVILGIGSVQITVTTPDDTATATATQILFFTRIK